MSPSPHIRVEVVDDHAVVRSGLRLLIETRPDLEVVAEAGTAADAIAAAAREQPDVILLDLDLGADSGLACLSSLRDAAPRARVLILTALRDPDLHHEALKTGARGVLVKSTAPDALLKAIERVHAGEMWLDRASTASLVAALSRGTKPRPPDPDDVRIASLTLREREVVALVAAGLRNKEIADRLHISEPTVRHHLTSIFGKLEVPDRLALAIYALKHGLGTNLNPERPLC